MGTNGWSLLPEVEAIGAIMPESAPLLPVPVVKVALVMVGSGFEVIAEIEPATRPDLTNVRHQVGVLAPVAQGSSSLTIILDGPPYLASPSPTKWPAWA